MFVFPLILHQEYVNVHFNQSFPNVYLCKNKIRETMSTGKHLKIFLICEILFCLCLSTSVNEMKSYSVLLLILSKLRTIYMCQYFFTPIFWAFHEISKHWYKVCCVNLPLAISLFELSFRLNLFYKTYFQRYMV